MLETSIAPSPPNTPLDHVTTTGSHHLASPATPLLQRNDNPNNPSLNDWPDPSTQHMRNMSTTPNQQNDPPTYSERQTTSSIDPQVLHIDTVSRGTSTLQITPDEMEIIDKLSTESAIFPPADSRPVDPEPDVTNAADAVPDFNHIP